MSTDRQHRPGDEGPLEPRGLRTLAWNRRVVVGLWYLTVYLALLYAAIRWGHRGGTTRFPGSD